MTLNEFINHIKHNSLRIKIYFYQDIDEYDEYAEELWNDTVGGYRTSVMKSHIGECDIVTIHPFNWDGGFSIIIDKEGAK